jgi:beta-N-acetylhexosaminidase
MRPDLTKAPFFLSKEEEKKIEEKIESLSLEQKAGQFFLVLADQFKEDELLSLASSGLIGGVLFRPVISKAELKNRLEKLDEVSPLPLLKAANLEQGANGAFKGGLCFASEMGVGATEDAKQAERLGLVSGQEGLSSGINVSFSPVTDLALNCLNPIINERAFSSQVGLVEKMAVSEIKGLQESGVAAVGKHFPGDGVDYRDQHLHPTYNSLSASEWERTYGRIYQKMVKKNILGFMAGHIVQEKEEEKINPKLNLSTCLPGSQSKELLSGYLRDRLGFNGVIFSDATIMGGYTQTLRREEGLITSINAGIDVLVFNTDYYSDYRIVLSALKDKKISPERLEEALIRILGLKLKLEKMKKEADKRPYPEEKWAEECSDKSITLVKDEAHLFPLDIKRFPRIKLAYLGEEETGEGNIKDELVKELSKAGFEVSLFDIEKEDLHSPEKEDEKSLSLICCNLPSESNFVTRRISWQKKHALDSPRFIQEHAYAFISFANPFHLQDVPLIKTFINAYTPSLITVKAVIEKMLGRSPFKGKSPVDAFCQRKENRL